MMIDLTPYEIPPDIILRAMLEYELDRTIKFGEDKVDIETFCKVRNVIYKVLDYLQFPRPDYQVHLKFTPDNRGININITRLKINRINPEDVIL